MLPSEVLSSTSLFLAASYVLITFLFPLHSTIKLKNNVSRWKSKFLPAIAILLSLFAVKLVGFALLFQVFFNDLILLFSL